MSDIYQSVANKYKGSPSAVVLFILAFIMFVLGINHFVEDTYSSYYGLKALESAYGLRVQIFDWTYWTMSLAPQIASMVFFYMYLSDTTQRKFLYLTLGAQAMDFFADSWYRSGGNLFGGVEVFSIASLLTFIYFSVGSEFFLSVGGGILMKLSAPALATWKITLMNLQAANRGQYSGERGDNNNNNKGNNKGSDKPFIAPKSEYKAQHRPEPKPMVDRRAPSQEPHYHPVGRNHEVGE